VGVCVWVCVCGVCVCVCVCVCVVCVCTEKNLQRFESKESLVREYNICNFVKYYLGEFHASNCLYLLSRISQP